MKPVLKWGALILAGTALGAAIYIRMATEDPAEWHVDPTEAGRTGQDNDYLVAPQGVAKAQPDRVSRIHGTDPRSLLFQLDAVARPSGAERLAGSIDDLWITYVDRSLVFGFPDYISVRAIPSGNGSALVIWSRSRYGRSDFGVNKDRIDGWLHRLGD